MSTQLARKHEELFWQLIEEKQFRKGVTAGRSADGTLAYVLADGALELNRRFDGGPHDDLYSIGILLGRSGWHA